MTPKNIPELIKLVERYETITLEEIDNEFKANKNTLLLESKTNLTGFGDTSHCTLCKATKHKSANSMDCTKCVYYTVRPLFYCCSRSVNAPTYYAIKNIDNPSKLLTAFRNRAEHIRKTFPQYFNTEY